MEIIKRFKLIDENWLQKANAYAVWLIVQENWRCTLIRSDTRSIMQKNGAGTVTTNAVSRPQVVNA